MKGISYTSRGYVGIISPSSQKVSERASAALGFKLLLLADSRLCLGAWAATSGFAEAILHVIAVSVSSCVIPPKPTPSRTLCQGGQTSKVRGVEEKFLNPRTLHPKP